MRIACVHVPQFALQTLTRIDPSLRGAAVAVVGAGGEVPRAGAAAVGTALYTPVVQACSRAAYALGVRIGMTATAAHGLAPGQLRVVTAEPALERETVRAIADALLGAAPAANGGAIVDLGGRVGAGGAHLAMYCAVPSKMRGTSFGDQLLEVLETLGVSARIGIADDRFTAWVAAAHAGAPGEEGGVIAVPRGGSAAFLAPRPLSLLSITPEVQHMLEALGVRTLGEFAALPAPSVTARASAIEADYRALARGESGQGLRPYAPDAPIREDLVLSSVTTASAAIAVLARRIALRLGGRGRGATALELAIVGPEDERIVPIAPVAARRSLLADTRTVLESADEVAAALDRHRELLADGGPARRLRVVVTGEAIAGEAEASEPAASAATPAAASLPPSIDALSVVLSTTGSSSHAAWTLVSPGSLRDERRDAHRRTRRGKQRRGREQALQARLLFDRLK